MQERRRFVRLGARLEVGYRVLPAGAAITSSASINVSGGGLCLVMHEPVNPGTFVELSLKLPGRERPLAVLAEVMWCEQSQLHGAGGQAGRSVQAGVRFYQIHPEDHQEIMRYIRSNLKNPSA